MGNKERYRDKNKEDWKKRQKVKKQNKIMKEKRQISRENRSFVRGKLLDYCLKFQKFADQHIIFVLDSNNNTEQVILQKQNIGNNKFFLSLPVINQELIENYIINFVSNDVCNSTNFTINSDETFLKGLFANIFGIDVFSIETLLENKLIIAQVEGILDFHNDLIEAIVKPYDYRTWFKESSDYTTLLGKNVYNGSIISKFLQIDELNSQYFIHQYTISELLVLKMHRGNIDFEKTMYELKNYDHRPEFSSMMRELGIFLTELLDVRYMAEIEARVEKGNEEIKSYQKRYKHKS